MRLGVRDWPALPGASEVMANGRGMAGLSFPETAKASRREAFFFAQIRGIRFSTLKLRIPDSGEKTANFVGTEAPCFQRLLL
jgi:hypothetical protein